MHSAIESNAMAHAGIGFGRHETLGMTDRGLIVLRGGGRDRARSDRW
jgi:hypothetical protein